MGRACLPDANDNGHWLLIADHFSLFTDHLSLRVCDHRRPDSTAVFIVFDGGV